MKIAEYKKIGTKHETYECIVPDYDDAGNVIGEHMETYPREAPVMGMVYRDETPEEIAERERMEAEMPKPEPTAEERLAAMEDALAEMMGVMFGG